MSGKSDAMGFLVEQNLALAKANQMSLDVISELRRTSVDVGKLKTEINEESRRCDHRCLLDDGHVERGELHFYGYRIPSVDDLLRHPPSRYDPPWSIFGDINEATGETYCSIQNATGQEVYACDEWEDAEDLVQLLNKYGKSPKGG